uniref:NACHT domain-containing protein n=1 Tax=Roseihalotalea indica TaxID=2867963 RepID=A0AA49GI68_9BACT|nr:NACHT domain-containing protein [Tunicatimonas sp. TK19036]
MFSIDFAKIRPHNGSQHNGFEELVCQLAHLEKPVGGRDFVRKEGAGGDAGVECYWKLENQNEHCWQAKYFLNEMNSSRWQQLDESFNTALNKHPNLTKYIISLPLDKTDSRKTGKGGKTVKSLEVEWNAYTEKWKKQAEEKGRTVEFEFWGAHELTLFLTKDDPLYSGRSLYWFNQPNLGFDTFERIFQKSRDTLDERYTPEFHVELPIIKKLDGLGLNEKWWERLNKFVVDLDERNRKFFQTFLHGESALLDKNELQKLESNCSEFIFIFNEANRYKKFSEHLERYRNYCKTILDYRSNVLGEKDENIFYQPENSSVRAYFYNFFTEYRELQTFLNSADARAVETKAALIEGDPGMGKSHLLCDLCLHRIEQRLPTVFILGSYYAGSDPLKTIKSLLDLEGYATKQVLGALDAAGEAYTTNTLIVIDAINEGSKRDEWSSFLRGFLTELSYYPNISLLLSCRTTYLNYIIPESVNDSSLVRITHFGFKGYEHRAAEKYLSQQGISKPSMPILAPEFTNPLFLKACCKALKTKGLTAFPKGLQGLTSLFDFYLESIESSIARRKKYNPNEEWIKKASAAFASELFPNNVEGIPSLDARRIISNFDHKPYTGEGLYDELLYDGVLSEDISYKSGKGLPVIRFTYERFSDQFIAQQLLSNYDQDSIKEIFSQDHLLGKILRDHRYYEFAGIFEALAILIPETFKIEFIDLLPGERPIENWFLVGLFTNSVIWRDPSSISGRTLQLIEKVEEHDNVAIDVYIQLSTEPNHPWNAEFLHKKLVDLSIAERDANWSIQIAHKDHEESEGQEETIVRALINWSCFGDISQVELERIRLCAVVLFWFLTTSNRKLRDQSTKSLVRLLTNYPELLNDLINKFAEVNDLYLVERLYAVAYGVVCNIEDDELVKNIAENVYQKIFESGKPSPHILLRDYARGILEYSHHKGLIDKDIAPSSFRPPYRSVWPIDNPSKEEIEAITKDEEYSHIKSSLMGFPGDFGNYTMNCVHDWSAASISEPEPKSGYEYKKEFAEKHLNGDIKTRYLEKIEPVNEDEGVTDFSLDDLSEDEKKEKIITFSVYRDEDRKKEQAFREEIDATLNDELKEYHRWLSGLWDDRPAAFSRKWAQRWVLKRAYSFGWRKELFESFESTCSYSRGGGYGASYMERVGKKYQWIAFHELLGYLADNLHWIDRGYSDVEDKEYYGPWQISKRDIDPTHWIKKTFSSKEYRSGQTSWWQNFTFGFDQVDELSDQKTFLWSEDHVPPFSKMLSVNDPKNQHEWIVLRGFHSETQKQSIEQDKPRLDGWFRINSLFIEKSKLSELVEVLAVKRLLDPDIIHVPSTQHQTFLAEYPWHKSCDFISGWYDPEADRWPDIPLKHFRPVSQYEWERGTDYSIDESLYFFLPAKELVEDLGLKTQANIFGNWVDDKSETVFFDPSLTQDGSSYALMRKDILTNWLLKNDLEIVWLVGGSKQLFRSHGDGFYGEVEFSGFYHIQNSGIVGDLKFVKRN